VQTTGEALAALDENWVSAGYSSPEEAAEALAEGRELLESHLQSPSAVFPGARVLYVERQLRKPMGVFDLVGRIDRVDERADGSLEIIDYKTHRKPDQEEVLHDVAMNVYALLLRDSEPGRRILTSILSIASQERVTAEPSAELLDEFERDVAALGTEIVAREFHEVEPQPKDLCERCDFLPLCRRHEAFEEAYVARYGAVESF
jgi:RecB family exonuclease